MEYYDIKIAGLNRKFPIVPLGPKYKVASFNILGDRELAQASAKALCSLVCFG